MLKQSAVSNAYMRLWNQFQAAVRGSGLEVRTVYNNGALVTRSGKTISVAAFFYMPQWPYKAVTQKQNKKVDILVQISETYDEDTSEVTKSTVQIGYFDVEIDKTTSLLQLHYDFESPAAYAHPIFHAQLGETKWPQERLASIRFEKTIEHALPLYANARIPTAHVGYGATLLALAADHLQRIQYTQFLDQLRKNASLQWGASCQSWRDSVGKHGTVPHLVHWYA